MRCGAMRADRPNW